MSQASTPNADGRGYAKNHPRVQATPLWASGSAQRCSDSARSAEGEQPVSETDNEPRSGECTMDRTAISRAGLLIERNPPAVGAEGAVPVPQRMPTSSASLVVTRGANTGSQFLLNRPISSAGRHPDADIFLDDPTVSRRHAEFRIDNGEVHVVDVGSLNGIYVNREPVESAALTNGDEVWIGKFRLRLSTALTTKTQNSSLTSS